jgi:hypothetical protein
MMEPVCQYEKGNYFHISQNGARRRFAKKGARHSFSLA